MELRTGDILFVSGTALVSKLIQKATKGVVNHVGLLYDRDTIFETDGGWGKAEFKPISRYNGKCIELYRYNNLSVNQEEEIKMLCNAYEGTPYSYWDIAVKGALCWLPSKQREKIASFLGTKSFMICNELTMRIMWESTHLPVFQYYEGSNPSMFQKQIRSLPQIFSRIL